MTIQHSSFDLAYPCAPFTRCLAISALDDIVWRRLLFVSRNMELAFYPMTLILTFRDAQGSLETTRVGSFASIAVHLPDVTLSFAMAEATKHVVVRFDVNTEIT